MAAVLSTNMASLYAQKNLSTAQTALSASVQRLSSGTRINSAKDDAAGIGIAESVKGIKAITDQSIRNAQNAISVAQTAEGALDVVGKILQRVLTLTQQKTDSTLNDSQKTSIDNEVTSLLDEIAKIKERTTFNGTTVFGKDYSFYSGSQVQATVHIADLSLQSLGLTSIALNAFPSFVPSTSNNFSFSSQLGNTQSTNDPYVIDTGYITFTLNGEGSGALGAGGNNPGLMYDPSGNSNYGNGDYIAPGIPYEGYTVLAGPNTISGSNEGYSPDNTTAQIWQVDSSTNQFVVLQGDQNRGFLTSQYMAKPGESVIRMRMSYTNTTGSNQTVSMVRGLDPDVDSNPNIPDGLPHTADTINTLGATGISSTDLVNAVGPYSGKAISLYIPGNGYTHNVAIVPSYTWPDYNPSDVLAGGPSSTNGDDAIEGAWDFGTVANGQTVSVDAYYICGNNVQQTIDGLTQANVTELTPTNVSAAIQQNATNRGNLGAQINSLNYAVDNMQTLSTNLADGISRIVDTDYAAETSNLTRTQILQQAATSMLAQANQMPNVILTLLK
jgi:flagellin